MLRYPPFIALFVALCCSPGIAQTAFADTLRHKQIERPGGRRTFELSLPGTGFTGKRPLIILLHGHGGSGRQVMGETFGASPLSVWRKIADREGLIVVAPDGLKNGDGKRGWNDCRSDAPGNPSSDDVGLVRALIAREIARDNADPQRVFVMGMSNGAMMSFRVAIELGDKLAGFAAVSGSMAAGGGKCAAPKVPLSALIIAGTADPLVPYHGGEVHFGRRLRGGVIGVEDSVAVWRTLAGLPARPVQRQKLPPSLPNDPTSVTRILWGADPKGIQVELIRVTNGGHIEPSKIQRARRFYTRIVGNQSSAIETAEAVWAFFRDKSRNNAGSRGASPGTQVRS